MTALHLSGENVTGSSRKDSWPPPEGTKSLPGEDNPLVNV